MIGDTPKDEKVEVTLASSFDLFTDHRVVQPFGGNWKVVSESHKHAKLNAYETQ